MGIVSSLFGGLTGRTSDEETDKADPTTGLTHRETHLVQASFELIRRHIKKIGVDLIIKLFEKYPEEQDRFPQFKKIPLKELRESKIFIAHCSTVMYSLSQIIDHLDDGEIVVELLNKIGENHKKANIPASSFWHLKDIFLDMLDGLMSREELESWDKTLNIAFTVVGQLLDS